MENAFQINRIHRLEGESKVKAFVDVSFAGIIVKGLKVVQGAKGLFLGMPGRQDKEGRWHNTVCPETPEAYRELSDIVLAAYNE